MKKRLKLGLFVRILIILLIIPLVHAKASGDSDTTISATIKDDLTVEILIVRSYNTGYWTDINNTFFLPNKAENIAIWDNHGNITIKETQEKSNLKQIVFDTHYRTNEGYKPLYIKYSTSLLELNDNFYQLDIPYTPLVSITGTEKERINLTIYYPEILKLFNSYPAYTNLEENKRSFNIEEENIENFEIGFLKKDAEDKFIKLNYEQFVFYLPDDGKIKEALNMAMNNKEIVASLYNLPSEKKLIIVDSDFSYLGMGQIDAWGQYRSNNVIEIKKDVIEQTSTEEVAAVILHELTHFAQSKDVLPLLWVSEGLSVLTEIEYIDKNFPEYQGHIPTNLDLYTAKTNMTILKKWYNSNLDIENLEIENNGEINIGEFYSIFGFIFNYYSKTYSKENLKNAISEINSNLKNSRGNKNNIIISALKKFSSPNITETELIKPKKALLETDEKAFEKEMKNFLEGISSAEALLKYQNRNKEEYIKPKSKIDNYILVSSIAVIIGGIILMFLILKTFKKRKIVKKE